jgi:hypothetical protein
MKITIFLFFVGIITLVANPSYSQNTRISLDMKGATVESVLNKIEEASEFYFLFNHKLINAARTVDIYAQNEPIKEILDKIFPNDVKFIVSDRQIVLTMEEGSSAIESLMQQRQITGKVTDALTGEAMAGVNIQIKGTSQGAITDALGMYTFTIPDKDAILIFSFIGYATQEAAVGGRSIVEC